MRNTFSQVILAILFTGICSAEKTNAQAVLNRMVTISVDDAKLRTVLKQLEDNTSVKFVYSNSLIRMDQRVTVQAIDQKLGSVLDKILNANGISYEAFDDRIVLSRNRQSTSGAIGQMTSLVINEAAQFIVRGRVADSQGEPLIGVSVKLKGANIGASTDVNGQYTLSLPDAGGILVFSYIGYLTKEIPVNNQASINVSLIKDSKSLEEVVVVGYGTQKKTNLTGAVDVISGQQLANRPAAKVQDLIKGASPNLQITMDLHGGEPGAESSWNIRGMGSIQGSSAPLVLVDGVEMTIGNVDPESIESVSILKDASASAIYGSRAPFGVILITTKKGKKGEKISIQYSNNLSANSPIRYPSMVSSLTWATAFNQANANAGLAPVYSDEQMGRIKGYLDGTFPYEYNPSAPINNIFAGRREGNANYDWPQLMMKDYSFSQKHNFNLSGGDQKTTYFVSGGFTGQDGLMNYTTDKYKRYNFLTNISSQVTDWLNFSSSLKYANSSTDYPDGYTTVGRENLMVAFIQFAPMMPMYNINGSIQAPFVRLMQDSGRDRTKTNDFFITLASELEPIKGWKTRLSYNGNYIGLRRTDNPKPVLVEVGTGAFGNIGKPNSGFVSEFANTNYQLYNVVSSYEKTLGGHYFNALAGYEQEEKLYAINTGTGTNLITTEVPSISTSLGDKTLTDRMYNWATQGIFGRLNYNFKEKYLVELSARYNGSSRFAKGSRWGFFPSASAGYTLSKENFWDPIKKYVNTFKIRGSYGALGNQNILDPLILGQNTAYYPYLSTIPVQSELNWILANQRPPSAGVPPLISNNLTWETITTLNLGLNAEFLKNRLELGFDWYNRVTTDMIGPSETLPYTLGAITPPRNNAELSTKGFEIVLKWRDNISSNFSYNAQLNIGDNKSKILKYTNDKGLITTWYNGKDAGEIWGYESDGLIQQTGEAMPDQSFFYPKWGPGDMKYKDLTGDGKVNPGSSTLDNHGDLTVIGNTTPRYNIGFTGGFTWKNIDFNMLWQGVGKRDYVADNNAMVFWGLNAGGFGASAIFKDSKSLDYWRPASETNMFGPNTDSYFAKPYFTAEGNKNRQTQSKYVLNASYLRLKNLQVGYNVPPRYASKLFLQRARIYISGENLLLLSKLPKNLDAETVIASTPAYGGYNSAGVIYPLSTSLSFGLNLTF